MSIETDIKCIIEPQIAKRESQYEDDSMENSVYKKRLIDVERNDSSHHLTEDTPEHQSHHHSSMEQSKDQSEQHISDPDGLFYPLIRDIANKYYQLKTQNEQATQERNDQIEVLTKKIESLERQLDLINTNNISLTNEYVKKIPILDKLYSEYIGFSFSGLTNEETATLLQDGRSAAFLIKKMLQKKWKGNDWKKTQIKMFTDYGTTLPPSRHIGTKRKINNQETIDHIEHNDLWVFVNITKFPNIKYIFKRNIDIMELYDTQGSKVTSFSDIKNI